MLELIQRRGTAGDRRLVAELRENLIRTVGEVVGAAHVTDLVDYPDHYNVGDAALWLGQRTVLGELGVQVASVSTRSTYDRSRLRADGPIIVLGGGNLGGLYATHHELKLSVLADFPGRPVIQLPQSLHYSGEQERDDLRRAIARHGATTLILRDQQSFALARRDFDCPVKLAPDMAFGLDALDARPPRSPVAVQVRTDKESAGSAQRADVEVFDWLEARPYEYIAAYQGLHRLFSRGIGRSDSRAMRAAFLAMCDKFAKANLRRGIAMLSTGERLVTDRLHGHVLACLLGVDHVVVNDRFGKIEAMWRTWTHRFTCAQFASTWAEADEMLSHPNSSERVAPGVR
ncbi:MAG TPA: polysaccharide pyruvyl transferase family protein [Solirubrobacteraceae bacterium]|nr:polysaccharide pyruvyl transferase family protein [Solirubrobacteraceae bacterium]